MGRFAYLPLVFVPFAVCFGADDPIAILKQLPRSPKLHFSATGVYEFQMDNEAAITDSFEVVMDGDQVMQVSNMSTSDQSLGKIVRAKNARYLFAIQRGESGADSIVALEPMANPKALELWESEMNASTPIKALLAGTRVNGIALSEFVSSPRFQLLSLKVLEDSGLWRVDFTYDFDQTGSFLFGYEASYFICDPSNNCFISESEYNVVERVERAKTQYRESMTPGVASGGVTLTQSYTRTTKFEKSIAKFKSNSETSLDLNPKVFFLSYYGFPEPEFQRGYTVWVLAAAALVIALSVFFIRRRRAAHG